MEELFKYVKQVVITFKNRVQLPIELKYSTASNIQVK